MFFLALSTYPGECTETLTASEVGTPAEGCKCQRAGALSSARSDHFKLSISRRKSNFVHFIKKKKNVVRPKKKGEKTEVTLIIMVLWFSCITIRNHFIYSSWLRSRQPYKNIFHGAVSKAKKSKGNPRVVC